MLKNVGKVVLSYEQVEKLHGVENALLLPNEVWIHRTYEDLRDMTFNVILMSKEPVPGFTFPTDPCCFITACLHEVLYGKYILIKA
jgi:hypothetical protein